VNPSVSLEIPPRSAYVGVVRLAISALARNSGLTEDRVDDLKIAVSEACANAVLAHSEAGTDENVLVSYSDNGDRLVIEVLDRGEDDRTADSPAAEDSLGISSRLMMSVALLESLVDDCEFLARPGGGTTTRLVLSR
jgi:serine/threonine-protein kinase RsbW